MEHLSIQVQDHIMQIQLNRPDKKNALTQAMYSALASAIQQAEADPTIHVVLMAGTGGAFTSGNDILDFLQSSPSNENSPVFIFLQAISNATVPIVAAVNGVAIGIGTTLLLHCDLVYASPNARFQLPFINLALVPEAGSSLILPAMLGQRRAAELLLLGEAFDAATAYEFGIVNKVVTETDLLTTAWNAAQQLAAKPAAALRLSKKLMKQHSAAAIQAAIKDEAAIFAQRLASPEAIAVFQAFLTRRSPGG
jgi:enoyl-CoA hydratase/carnithine racemase